MSRLEFHGRSGHAHLVHIHTDTQLTGSRVRATEPVARRGWRDDGEEKKVEDEARV